MTVYVDELREWPGAPRSLKASCHMMADSDAELDEMAVQLGLKLAWRHGDHFDLSPGQRRRALALGALGVTSRTLVLLRQTQRKQLPTNKEKHR